MKFFSLTSAIALSSCLGSALAAPQKRATTTPLGQIFAYGTNITGFPVFVSEGIAYIGNVSLATAAGAANVTCELADTFCLCSHSKVTDLIFTISRRKRHRNLSPQAFQQRHHDRQ